MNNTLETIVELLKTTNLSEREIYVLSMRLLNKTLREIGVSLGIQSERTRQIEAKGCRKLKSRINRCNFILKKLDN
jgi:DNA-directed RNA polymerase sigma subunit (sigma70/sigma32)